MNHGHDIDGMLAGDGFTARQLRLHLDNSHDERTTGWDFARLHALHQELHGPRLAEIEAAANLIADRLAAAEPAVVERVAGDDALSDEALSELESYFGVDRPDKDVLAIIAALRASRAEVERLRSAKVDGDRSLYLTDANGTVYLAETVWAPGALGHLYRLVVQDPPADDPIARGAELARQFNAAGRPEMPEGGEQDGETRPAPRREPPSGEMPGSSPPGTAGGGGAGADAGAATPAAPREVPA